jgi:hypothetical protein
MPESIRFTAVELSWAISRNAVPGCINSISKRPTIILVFKTRCKPKCSLWDCMCCPKLVKDFWTVATSLPIRFGTKGPWLHQLYLQEILFIHPK